MDSLFINFEAIVPTFLAIMSLVLFTPKTRWFSYTIILLSIGAELVPLTVNTTALLACVSCMFGLMVAEFVHTHNLTKPILHRHTHR